MKVAALAFLLVAGPLFARAAPADCIRTEQRSYLGIKTIAGPSRGLSLEVSSSTDAKPVTGLCPGSSYTVTAKGVSNPTNARARVLLTSTVGNFSSAGTCPGAVTVANSQPTATLLVPCNTTGSATVAVYDVGTARDLAHKTATKTLPILGEADCPTSTCWAPMNATAANTTTATDATLPAAANAAPAVNATDADADSTTDAPATNSTMVSPVDADGDTVVAAPGSNATDTMVPAVNGTTDADTMAPAVNGTVPMDGLVNSTDSMTLVKPVDTPNNAKASSPSSPAAAAGTKAKSAAGAARSPAAMLAGVAAAGLVALLL